MMNADPRLLLRHSPFTLQTSYFSLMPGTPFVVHHSSFIIHHSSLKPGFYAAFPHLRNTSPLVEPHSTVSGRKARRGGRTGAGPHGHQAGLQRKPAGPFPQGPGSHPEIPGSS